MPVNSTHRLRSTLNSLTPLDFEPWGDPVSKDFGDIVHLDHLTTAKVACKCANCSASIKAGEPVRERHERLTGVTSWWRWCQACCDAMMEEMKSELTWDEESPQVYPYTSRGLKV